MNEVTLYSTHCPQCNVLEKKLQAANIEYNVVEDIKEIRKLGYLSAPILKVNNKTYLFKEACTLVDNFTGTSNVESECESCKLA